LEVAIKIKITAPVKKSRVENMGILIRNVLPISKLCEEPRIIFIDCLGKIRDSDAALQFRYQIPWRINIEHGGKPVIPESIIFPWRFVVERRRVNAKLRLKTQREGARGGILKHLVTKTSMDFSGNHLQTIPHLKEPIKSAILNSMQETFFERCRRVFKKYGAAGFIKKGFFAILHKFEPLKVIYYPYIKSTLPREVNRPYTVEKAVDYSLNRFGGFIRPSQVKWEISSLAEIVQKLKPKTVVEVGTSKGGTLFLWARLASPDAHLVSIDLPGGENNWAYPRWKEPFYKSFASQNQKIDLLRGNSQSEAMIEELKKILGNKPIDFLFIDADHTYEGVKKDYELYSPLVSSGGVIAFHDIAQHPKTSECRVKDLWDQIKQGKKIQEFIENPEQGWGGIGVIFV
jgi:predicted O-methyltransferase YrrM